MGPGSVAGDAEALVGGMEALAARAASGAWGPLAEQQPPAPLPQQPPQPPQPPQQQLQQQRPQQPLQQASKQRLTPREAFFAPTERVPIAAAVGRVCAELLCPYPPGVPLLLPGEVVGEGDVAALRATLRSGGVVVGVGDARLDSVLVVAGG